MNRGLWVVTWVAGCSFGSPRGGELVEPDATRDSSVPDDAEPSPEDAAACPRWQADFSVDPTRTTLPEWRVRNAQAFQGSLVDGVWQVDGKPPIDTTPDHDFAGRTTVTGRLRCTRDNGNRDDECAVLWVNVGIDDDGPTMAGLYVDVHREGQSAVVLLKQREIAAPLAEHVVDSTPGFVEVRLTIDHPARLVRLEVLPAIYDSGPRPYTENASVNNDRWASAWGARASEFDFVHVESCPE